MGYEEGLGEWVRNGQRGQHPSRRVELLSDARALAEDGSLAGRYMAALAANGSDQLIGNAASQALLLRHDKYRLPVTVEDGDYGHTYVASPHSAYVLYARDEIDIVGLIDVFEALPEREGDGHYLMIDYVCRWAGGDVVAGDDAEEAAFLPFPEALSRLAWDKTRTALQQAQAAIRKAAQSE